MDNHYKILTGNANPALAAKICCHLDVKAAAAVVDNFPGGEIHVQISENVRGTDMFIVQPICASPSGSPNDALMEMLILIDAARRSSAGRITAVIPYFGYARQDRKDKPRVPITAKLACNLLVEAGADRILAMDLHSNQIQAFVDIPFDHLYAIKIFGPYLAKRQEENLTIGAPDIGGTKMARAYAEYLKAPLVIVDKRRLDADRTEIMNVVGEVAGKNVIFVDDICSTAGTLAKAAEKVKNQGALTVGAACVHPVLATGKNGGPSAVEIIEASALDWVAVSDSIPLPADCGSKITVVSVATLLGEAIRRIHNGESISTLFVDQRVEG